MSAGFQAVQWNRAKLVYDAVLILGIAVYILGFIAIGRWVLSPADDPAEWSDLVTRSFGTCAFLMLTLILCIGPLARLNPRFLPLLYNRRHFGVMMVSVALVHAWSVVDWYIVHDKLEELLADMTSLPYYTWYFHFPFETLGFLALCILIVMAATSHDFWLNVLTPPVWKGLHMAVYIAYGLLVLHIGLGVMQTERHWLIPVLLGGAFLGVAVLHLVAGRREARGDRGGALASDGWLAVGPLLSIPDRAARIVAAPNGERIAVFRDGDRIGAVSNLCAHQNGPVGEGRIIDGCITCPWHGWQYRLEDGCSPPPFTERLATYRLRLLRGVIEVDPRPLPPGMPAAMTVPR